MKEFQSHKQDPKDVSAIPEVVDVNPSAEPHQQFNFNAFDPPKVEENIVQQQQVSTFVATSTPQISNYFDGASFDIPQQQFIDVQEFTPQHQHQEVSFLPSQVSFSQQFMAPTPAAQDVYHDQIQQPTLNNDLRNDLQHQLELHRNQFAQLKSELEFHRMTATNLQKNTDELNRLRQETQSHVDVVKVLVSEKSHLMDALQKTELTVKAKADENDELQNRLNMSRHRVKQLESEVRSGGTGKIESDVDTKKVDDIVASKIKNFQELNERVEMEKNELKVLLNQKRIEMENLQKNFDHLSTELHLANVKIAQLSDGSPTEVQQPQLNVMSQELAIKQQQITELYSVIDQVNRDKEASDNQYQNYVTHLTREMGELKESSMELSNENDSLVRREQELLKHVSDLERQIQQQMQKQKTYADDQRDATTNPPVEELQKLTSQVAALTESNESFKSQFGKLEAEKNELAQQLVGRLEEMRSMELLVDHLKCATPNVSQLMTDFEDKSVAASRALSQNQGLKDQLDEMQRAFITMTNDKMELTDRLSSEMHLCKEMKIRYDFMETELEAMKEKWHYKEDEMIRLSHENTELEKKIFQQNIEIDRLRHYEGVSSSREYQGAEGVLEKELENSKRLIDTLSNKINILESERSKKQGEDSHDHHSHDGHSHSHDGHSHSHDGHSHDNAHSHKHEAESRNSATDDSKKHLLEEIAMLQMEKNELLKAMSDFQMNKKPVNSDGQEVTVNGTLSLPEMNEAALRKLSVSKSVTPSMATEEALEKLQARFRRTMLEVAELTEEKQRLEHVVTQLQFETETIGEYITLYQYQRRLLKQKEHERDCQLKNLSADREKMNDKLVQLNGLIEKFVLQHTDNVELAKEASKFLDQDKSSDPLIIRPEHQNDNMTRLKQETAGKILEILSDIKSANSISYDSNIGVEHCSCCLGKLETV